jgi:hypothetical protein
MTKSDPIVIRREAGRRSTPAGCRRTAALIEVTVEDFLVGRREDAREVRRVKFKLADKIHALELPASITSYTSSATSTTGAPVSPSAWRTGAQGCTKRAPPQGARPVATSSRPDILGKYP